MKFILEDMMLNDTSVTKGQVLCGSTFVTDRSSICSQESVCWKLDLNVTVLKGGNFNM